MKKVFALAMALLLTIGMTTAVWAADPEIDGLASNNVLQRSYIADTTLGSSWSTNLRGSATVAGSTVTYNRDIIPSDKVRDYIDLPVNAFTWKNGEPANKGGLLTSRQISKGKVALRTSVSSGTKAVDSISVDESKGRIEIRYVEEYASTKELDFQFTIYLTVQGKRQKDAAVTFVGTLANEVVEVYNGDDYVDLSYGRVADAVENVSNIEVDLGNGISIFTRLNKGKKYYGTCSVIPDDKDNKVLSKYPDVDHALTLTTIGLNGSGDVVKLDTDYDGYYVYDKNMKYLGRSSQMMPYSDKYYLANRELRADDSSASTPSEDPGRPMPEEPSGGDGNGGDVSDEPGFFDWLPGNTPDTGVGGALKIALLAAGVSLAAVLIFRPGKGGGKK